MLLLLGLFLPERPAAQTKRKDPNHPLPVSALYARVNPAVVVIKTIQATGEGPPGESPVMLSQAGLGSGVLISEEGDILTASHVVNTAEAILVELEGEEPIPADVVAAVAEADVALIRLRHKPRQNIPVVRLADSDLVRVGDQVMVIGAPFGIGHSLSVGYVSGRHAKKNMTGAFTLMEFLQTDAAINQGNSGGPLFNMNGEVVGIVSAILTQTGGFQGLGFAATSNIARKLLLEQRVFWFGVEGYFLSGPMTAVFNLPQAGGVLIQKTVSSSPAGHLGIRAGHLRAQIEGQALLVGGDVLLAFDGIALDSEEGLVAGRQRMAALRSHDPYSVEVYRAGQRVTLQGVVP